MNIHVVARLVNVVVSDGTMKVPVTHLTLHILDWYIVASLMNVVGK